MARQHSQIGIVVILVNEVNFLWDLGCWFFIIVRTFFAPLNFSAHSLTNRQVSLRLIVPNLTGASVANHFVTVLVDVVCVLCIFFFCSSYLHSSVENIFSCNFIQCHQKWSAKMLSLSNYLIFQRKHIFIPALCCCCRVAAAAAASCRNSAHLGGPQLETKSRQHSAVLFRLSSNSRCCSRSFLESAQLKKCLALYELCYVHLFCLRTSIS